ncbi:hypothetical protein F5X96DRAFT_682952 [Biscogniauxia mediterranea]|nr:hypothetical protein F5X96DRAFT_682952 [Biscogniauxia mediterranea]
MTGVHFVYYKLGYSPAPVLPPPFEVELVLQAVSWLELPTVLGSDVAGEVIAIGSETTSRFSEYLTVKTHLASHPPSHVSHEQASVVPLALITASVGLFGKGYLELQHPSVKRKPTGKSLLFWGGATIGSCTIQVAVSAGYEVITTASPKNFDPTVQDDIISVLSAKASAGVLAIAGVDAESRASVTNACLDVASEVDGVKFISMAMPAPDKLLDGINAKFIIAFDLKTDLELGNAIFRDYLPNALASGKYTAAPPAEVLEEGLKALQEGLDILQKGVLVKKLVVTM